MNMLLPLASSVLSRVPSVEQRSCRFYRSASIALLGAYAFGCIGLYFYLLPEWGKAFSLLAIGAILLLTSGILFGIGWFLKPKSTPLAKVESLMEKGVGALGRSPFPILAIIGGIATLSYLASAKSKEN